MALVAEGGEPLKVTGARVSDNLFDDARARRPSAGRSRPGDGTPGRERVTVISDGLWRQRFAGDPARASGARAGGPGGTRSGGRDAADFEVLGERADLWVPLPFAPGTPAQR